MGTQTEVILRVDQATRAEPDPVQLQELQPVSMETIANFGFDVDVANICQATGFDSVTTNLDPDIPPEHQWTSEPELETWRLFTPIPEVQDDWHQAVQVPTVEASVSTEVQNLIAMDIQRFSQLVAQHPITERIIRVAQDLITVGEVEFQYLSSHGYGQNHAMGPVHRSWTDVERNYEKYLTEALKPTSYRQERCGYVFHSSETSSVKYQNTQPRLKERLRP